MVKVFEKYSPTAENDIDKLVMSNGAYAVCQMLEELKEQIGKLTAAMSR